MLDTSVYNACILWTSYSQQVEANGLNEGYFGKNWEKSLIFSHTLMQGHNYEEMTIKSKQYK